MPVFIKENSDNKKLKEMLAAHQIPVSETENKKSAIVYYENDSCSWKTIIAAMRHESKRNLYFFHGSGTHALVGSRSGWKEGEVIVL